MNKFSEVRPFIRYAQMITISDSVRLKNISAYDFRLFYVMSGEGSIKVDKTEYRMQRGALLIFRPGLEYSLINPEGESIRYFALSFDLDFLNSDKKSPIPPSRISDFNPSLVVMKEKIHAGAPFFLPVFLQNAEKLLPLLLMIFEEYNNKFKNYEHKISGLALAVLSEVYDSAESRIALQTNETTQRIISIIKERYGQSLTNEDIAREVGYHPNHLNRLMVKATGVSLHRYLLAYRIERALDALEMTDLPISEIASAVGFDDFSYFSKQFKRKTGYSPSEYRRSHRCEQN